MVKLIRVYPHLHSAAVVVSQTDSVDPSLRLTVWLTQTVTVVVRPERIANCVAEELALYRPRQYCVESRTLLSRCPLRRSHHQESVPLDEGREVLLLQRRHRL